MSRLAEEKTMKRGKKMRAGKIVLDKIQLPEGSQLWIVYDRIWNDIETVFVNRWEDDFYILELGIHQYYYKRFDPERRKILV